MCAEATPPVPGTPRRLQRRLLLIALIALAPVAASYLMYHFWPREKQMNYGRLYATTAPRLAGTRLDGAPFALPALRGRWVIVTAAHGGCDATCRRNLYAGRQARTIQNAERDRIARVWLVTDAATPPAEVLAEHADLMVVRAEDTSTERLPERGRGSWLIDPLGNLVLAWPDDPDIKAVARDLSRLLRASRIG
jgi:cytochrome oxidase Cu insertion factor (SCO1/SenC/PrrC family)